jgi:DNA ligase-1
MQDAEYVVIGVEYGKATYNEGGHKEFDVVSSLIIEHKGNHVNVGSGLSKEQRLNWYNNSDDILGKTITVQYFEETKDSKTGEYSLRFPVLKHVYDDGRTV